MACLLSASSYPLTPIYQDPVEYAPTERDLVAPTDSALVTRAEIFALIDSEVKRRAAFYETVISVSISQILIRMNAGVDIGFTTMQRDLLGALTSKLKGSSPPPGAESYEEGSGGTSGYTGDYVAMPYPPAPGPVKKSNPFKFW